MKNTLFGTDGIRNTVGTSPFTLSHLPRLGTAIARWAHNKYNTEHPIALLASDTRISSSFVKNALSSGMLLHGNSIVDAGILPTPALFALLKNQKKFHYGIMISASHNPYQDNGIKLVDAYRGKLTEHDEQIITALFHEDTHPSRYNQLGSISSWPEAAEQYSKFVLNHFEPNFLAYKTIVLDCAHGATSHIAPAIFNALGAHTITINANPNGTNINDQCGTLHPEQLVQAVKKYNACMGFAFDGDGDRVTVVNNNGVIKNGDDCLALLATHPQYTSQKTVVGTIMSNEGLAAHLHRLDKKLIRTPVGDKYINAYLETHNLLLGGEQSGHIIMRDYLNTGDGIFTALRILETIVLIGNSNLLTFTKYPQILINIPILTRHDLSKPPYADVIASYTNKLKPGRLEIRYSGTENILRVMIECEDEQNALSVGNQLTNALKELMESE